MNFDISWPLAMLSITGTVFNVKKKVTCFYIWAIGEIFWIALDFKNKQYGRVLLDAVHLGMAIWGIWSWRDKNFKTRIKKNQTNPTGPPLYLRNIRKTAAPTLSVNFSKIKNQKIKSR